jgi:predicted CXXCH cytochrome family protein
MKISMALFIVPMVMFLFAAFALPTAFSAAEPPSTVSIDNDGYQPDRKGAVDFSHAAHADSYGISCEACHHEYEDGVNVWTAGDEVISCNECHEAKEGDNGMLRLKMAYHQSCQGCHKEKAVRAGGVAPYNRCNVCHDKGKTS